MTELYHIFGYVFATYSLETSINQSAPFAAGYLGVILSFLKCKNAPFRAAFLGMITYELIRRHTKFNMINPRRYWQSKP